MRLPTIRIIRTPYPDWAGLWMRAWDRHGLLVSYRYCRAQGFFIVGIYPRWRWLLKLVARLWPYRFTFALFAAVVAVLTSPLWCGGGR